MAILNVLVRLVSPVLSFTADEVWQVMRQKGWASSSDQTIFTSCLPPSQTLNIDAVAWEQSWPLLKNMRTEVNRVLDEMRKNKALGSNLEAEVTYALPADHPLIQKISDSGELHYFLITSQFQAGQNLVVNVTENNKCSRCWHYTPHVKVRPNLISDETQGICQRCYENLAGQGVRRQYF